MLKIFYEIYNYIVNIHTKQDCKAFQSHMMPKWDMMTKLTEDYSMVEVTKVLAKQDGPGMQKSSIPTNVRSFLFWQGFSIPMLVLHHLHLGMQRLYVLPMQQLPRTTALLVQQ